MAHAEIPLRTLSSHEFRAPVILSLSLSLRMQGPHAPHAPTPSEWSHMHPCTDYGKDRVCDCNTRPFFLGHHVALVGPSGQMDTLNQALPMKKL
jgi:hypothetical protein